VSQARPVLKLFLDEGVPDSVGKVFKDSGHKVIYLRDAIATGSPDQFVCAVSEANDAILVALDADMRRLAQRHGVGQRRYRKLSLIKLSCRESKAAERVQCAMSFIEHEWNYSAGLQDRRIFIEINIDAMHTKR
jgi:predicted nuclease of predicted toxin-antitoxin system